MNAFFVNIKKIFNTPSHRLVLLMSAIIVLLFIASVLLNERASISSSERIFTQQAIGNVNYFKSLIDPKTAQAMFEEMSYDSLSSQKIRAVLDNILENNSNISLVYIHGITDDSLVNNQTLNLGIPTLMKDEVTVGSPYHQTDDFMAAIRKAIETGQAVTTPVYTDSFGTWMTALVPIVSPDGEIRTVFGIDQDASSIKNGKTMFNLNMLVIAFILLIIVLVLFFTGRILSRNTYLNERIDESNHALEKQLQFVMENEKMSALGSLVAGVAHEINTPLGVAITSVSYLNDITEKYALKYEERNMSQQELTFFMKESVESTAIILKNLSNAADLIQSFKKIAVNQSHESFSDFNVLELINSVIMTLRHELKNQDVHINVDCPEELYVYSDPGALVQITTNLLMNSLRHAPKPGQPLNINLQFYLHPLHELNYKFQDDGKGILKSDLHRIFDPFFTTDHKNGGTGLGLSIVHTLVTNRLKGHLNVTSEENSGCLFTMTFPVQINARTNTPLTDPS